MHFEPKNATTKENQMKELTIYQDTCPITGRKRQTVKNVQELIHMAMYIPKGELTCTRRCKNCENDFNKERCHFNVTELTNWDGEITASVINAHITPSFKKRNFFSRKGLEMAVAGDISSYNEFPVGEGTKNSDVVLRSLKIVEDLKFPDREKIEPADGIVKLFLGSLRTDTKIITQGFSKQDLQREHLYVVFSSIKEKPLTTEMKFAIGIANNRLKHLKRGEITLRPTDMEKLSAELVGAPHWEGKIAHRAWNAGEKWKKSSNHEGKTTFFPEGCNVTVREREDHDLKAGDYFYAYSDILKQTEVSELTSWGEEIIFHPHESKIEFIMWVDSPAWAIVKKYI